MALVYTPLGRWEQLPWERVGKSLSLNFSLPQGKFPKGDKAEDGFHGVSPVNAFPPQNNYGKIALQVAVMSAFTARLVGWSCLKSEVERSSTGKR